MQHAYEARLAWIDYMKHRSSGGRANRVAWLRSFFGIMHASYYTW